MKAFTPTKTSIPSSSFKLAAITIALSLSGCSFKEDRADIVVPIVDATPTKTVKTPEREKEQQQDKVQATYTYTVRSGDTLGTISQEYLGSANRYTELLELNQLSASDSIYVGQRLKLPTKGLKVPQQNSIVSSKSPKLEQQPLPDEATYPELQALLKNTQYNQAIQWILSRDDLEQNKNLQEKLTLTAIKQSGRYKRQQKTDEAETLLSSLISQAPIAGSYKATLEKELSTLRAEQQLLTAKRYADKSQYDESYEVLLNAWQEVGEPLQENILFTTTRNKVSENYHQKALRHYRNQELEQASVFWQKILAINPNDDLALVYQDRVKALQNKLENL